MKESPFSKNWLIHRVGRRCIEEASRFARGSLLDVGCGQKPYYVAYARGVESYVGMDLPRGAQGDMGPDVYGDALSLPFGDGVFDTVVSFQVMEHVREPWVMTREIARVLAPGGHAVISAPLMWGLHEVPHDYFRFTEYGFRQLFESSGLEVLSVRAMGGYWVTAGTRFCYYLDSVKKRMLTPLFGLAFFVVQSVCLVLDRIHRLETDTWNYIAVGRKPC